MSTANPDHLQLLDQLQNEVNLVLEQSARLFAATNNDSKAVPLAQASRLKQILPGSIYRFHDALDQLEEELQTAKLVMRRDLALNREQAAPQKLEQTNGVAVEATSPKLDVSHEKQNERSGSEKLATSGDADVAMEDAKQSELLVTDDSKIEDAAVSKEISSFTSDASKAADEEADSQPPEDAVGTDNKPAISNSPLQLDTRPKDDKPNGEEQTEEDRELDTGTFSNTNDFDSLFGGPTSAGPGDAPDFGIDPNDNAGFDFDDFSANIDNNTSENDNISSLLPGLEDYANTQPTGSGDTNFDALFSTDLPINTEGQKDGQAPSTQHRDSTFDDLLDFTDFNDGDFASGEGSNENQDFDFSFH